MKSLIIWPLTEDNSLKAIHFDRVGIELLRTYRMPRTIAQLTSSCIQPSNCMVVRLDGKISLSSNDAHVTFGDVTRDLISV